MLARFPASFTALVAVYLFWSPAQAAGDQSPDVPDAVIDLRTPEGVSLIDGQWRYTDVHITDSEFRAPGPDNKPSGPAVKTHDIHPRIGTPDFDSAQWQAIQADTLESRRTNGRLAFAWYRLDFTVPEKIGDFATAGSTAVFEITVDDYAEVWVDGSLSQTLGQSGGQLIKGWNAPNRVTIARDAKPGQRIQVAVFAANGPLSGPPPNYVWIRSATLDFYKPGRGWVNTPAQVPTEIIRLDPALDAIVAPGTKAERLADGFSFTEGPIWLPQLAQGKTYGGGGAGGYLLFSDPNKNVIHRWDPGSGEVSIFRTKSGYTGTGGADIGEYHQPGSNGLTLSPDGRLTICEHGNRRVTRLEPNGSITVLADRYEGKRLNSPNDLVYRSDGTLFFTDPPFGLPKVYDDPRKELPYSGVFCVHNGVLRLVASELKGPNGLAFSPDEKHLYVDNWDEQKKVIVRYDVAPDGTLSNATTLVDLTSDHGEIAFDGLKVDASGNIYVSAPGGLRVFSSEGKHLGTISLPEIPANFTFGDSDGRTLYMTARTGLYRIRLNVPGSSQAPTVPNPAGAPKLLRAGDAAPKVGHVEWLKGEPIDLNDRKHAYLMEFWATWCGPCVQQIPHLNDLQKKFESRGLVVVGMNSGDKQEGAVREFVSKRGDDIGYRIAYDPDRSVWRQFAQAGGFDAIPLLLVIDRSGTIAYFDHPRPDFDTIVERVLNGTWEPGKDKPAESRKSVIAREVSAKVKSGDFDGAYHLLDREAAAEPGLAGYAAKLKFRTAYFDRQDWGAARAFAEGMLEGPAGKDAESLADVAEWMINEGAPPVREYSVATKLATRAVELTGAKDGSILDILARCNFHLGDLERAVEVQAKAVNLMPEGQAKANMAETLRLMKERQEQKRKVEQK